MTALAAALIFFAGNQESSNHICWESIGLYKDREYKKKLPEDDWIMEKFKERGHKYVKRVKTTTQKILSGNGLELVECPIHRPECLGHTKDCKKEHRPDDGILKKVDDPSKPYHMRLLMTYAIPLNRVRVYVKIEVYQNEMLLFSFEDDDSISWRTAMSYKKRGEEIVKFGNKIAVKLANKIREHQANR